MTSNYTIEECFGPDEMLIGAMKRRFPTVISLTDEDGDEYRHKKRKTRPRGDFRRRGLKPRPHVFIYKTMVNNRRRIKKTRGGAKKRRVSRFMARAAPKRKASRAMRRLIQAEIAREIENKDTQYYNLSKNLVGVASSSFQDNVIQLGPNNNGTESMVITQGVGVNSESVIRSRLST